MQPPGAALFADNMIDRKLDIIIYTVIDPMINGCMERTKWTRYPQLKI